MTTPLTPPAWLDDDPYPGGPHWTGCERSHPGCAWRAGVEHGLALAATCSPTGRDDESEDELEALDRAALSGACADETDWP